MAPMTPKSENGPRGPAPSSIQLAKPYVFEQTIQDCLHHIGVSQTREDSVRLAGVLWIDNVRKALRLPVRTFDTAVIYYHKFRLLHADGEYSYVDAAAAALFSACKIEDTLKKSRDILCAAHNLRLQPSEHLSPDDALFEAHSRSIIGLERLMLEASSFDFRGRHPQLLLVKLTKYYGFSKGSAVAKTSYDICLDLYRTFAPLKQTTATLAFASLELAGRLLDQHNEDIENGVDYHKWRIGRAEVMETLLDLLELYTHYRTSTAVGPDFTVDAFLEARIPLNTELSAKRLPRFTENIERKAQVNGVKTNGALPSRNAIVSPKDVSPASSNTVNGTATNGALRTKPGERGKDGTVRFMLNPDQEQEEKKIVAEYD